MSFPQLGKSLKAATIRAQDQYQPSSNHALKLISNLPKIKSPQKSIQNYIHPTNERAEFGTDAPLIVGVSVPARRDFAAVPQGPTSVFV